MTIIRLSLDNIYTTNSYVIGIVEKKFCPMFINAGLDIPKFIYGLGLHQPEKLYNNDELYEILHPGPYLFVGGGGFRIVVEDEKFKSRYASYLVWRGV